MKALVLAAGRGERLRPLTDRCPKPMIPIAGKPLLERIVVQLREADITSLWINLHHRPDSVRQHFQDGSRFGVTISYSFETDLLGTAGAAKKLEKEFQDTFLVYYGDNYVEVDLKKMIAFHRAHRGLGTIAVFEAQEMAAGGVVESDPANRVRRFLEKPAAGQTPSRQVNAGIYVVEPAVFQHIPSDRPSDFGRDIFPKLLADGRPLYAYPLSGTVIGIDTPALISRLQKYLSQGGAG